MVLCLNPSREEDGRDNTAEDPREDVDEETEECDGNTDNCDKQQKERYRHDSEVQEADQE